IDSVKETPAVENGSNDHKNTDSETRVMPRPMCRCGFMAKVARVKKENPNVHRLFFTCPASSCSFFRWLKKGMLPDSAKCLCGRDALEKVSENERSSGRKYTACSEEECEFFEMY
ncbi:hypothetical protein PMAYCL1PPCAC_15868, partial [Pristionchus mayeri]